MVQIDLRNFKEEVTESEKLCVVEFGSKYCPPCKSVKKTMEELEPQYLDVKFCHVDAEASWNLSKKCAVDKLPQILIFKGNLIKRRVTGYIGKDELAMLISNVQKFI